MMESQNFYPQSTPDFILLKVQQSLRPPSSIRDILSVPPLPIKTARCHEPDWFRDENLVHSSSSARNKMNEKSEAEIRRIQEVEDRRKIRVEQRKEKEEKEKVQKERKQQAKKEEKAKKEATNNLRKQEKTLEREIKAQESAAKK